MRFLIFITTVSLLSCGQNTADKKPVTNDSTSAPAVKKDTAATTNPEFYSAPDEAIVNGSLAAKPGNKWHVMNDKEAGWMKDVFDYFITPKRKEKPDYPYITMGDFNGDDKPDTAAVVTDGNKKEFRIVILTGSGKLELWEEDILINAALSTFPKGTIEGGDPDNAPKKIKMKSDGINVEYFEVASFVLYWAGNSFKKIQTGD